ncbi:hypothetical protein, partial [Trinickia sp.]|uniref:hypothetical protein n=1 Tax=Trinickia sp. TaxID=2571163 RepID=UPI003F807879
SIVEPFYDTGFHSTNSLEILIDGQRPPPEAQPRKNDTSVSLPGRLSLGDSGAAFINVPLRARQEIFH